LYSVEAKAHKDQIGRLKLGLEYGFHFAPSRNDGVATCNEQMVNRVARLLYILDHKDDGVSHLTVCHTVLEWRIDPC